MPRQVERNYLPMAISMNEQAWAKQAPCHDKVDPAIDALFAKSAHRLQADLLRLRRSRLVDHILYTTRAPRVFYSPMLRDAGAEQRHIGDVIETIKREIDRQINRGKQGHYLFDADKLRHLRDAMVFARYFRRFGFRVWRIYPSVALRMGFSTIAASNPHEQQVAA